MGCGMWMFLSRFVSNRNVLISQVNLGKCKYLLCFFFVHDTKSRLPAQQKQKKSYSKVISGTKTTGCRSKRTVGNRNLHILYRCTTIKESAFKKFYICIINMMLKPQASITWEGGNERNLTSVNISYNKVTVKMHLIERVQYWIFISAFIES